MKRIPLTQGKEAIVDDQDYEWLVQWNWCMNGGYAGRRARPNFYYMHKEIATKRLGFPSELKADHINGNPLDNRRENLRSATQQMNGINAGLCSTNTSGFKGVAPEKGQWSAQIHVMGHKKFLGYFDDKVEAAKVYNAAAKKHFGEFAWLNPIPEED